MAGVSPTYWLPGPVSQGFVLRFWGERAGAGCWAWRASVTDLASQEKRAFSHPEQLEAYFRGLGVGWPGERQPGGEP